MKGEGKRKDTKNLRKIIRQGVSDSPRPPHLAFSLSDGVIRHWRDFARYFPDIIPFPDRRKIGERSEAETAARTIRLRCTGLFVTRRLLTPFREGGGRGKGVNDLPLDTATTLPLKQDPITNRAKI